MLNIHRYRSKITLYEINKIITICQITLIEKTHTKQHTTHL